MRFEILNVEHGFCAYAIGSDGGVLLFDCGHGSANRPETYLPDRGITNIRRFFVANYDEDHINDLLAVRRNLHIEVLTRNPSMTSGDIPRDSAIAIAHAAPPRVLPRLNPADRLHSTFRNNYAIK